MNKILQIKERVVKISISLVLCSLSLLMMSFTLSDLQQKVSLNLKEATIAKILLEIQKQTEINFIFDKNEVSDFGKKDIQIKNQNVDEALNSILENSGYTYKIVGNSISIVKEAPKPQVQPTQQSKITINSRVIDASTKKPISGATVIIGDGGSGAITDDNGDFKINAAIGDKVEISFIGMKPYTGVISNNFPKVITLAEDAMKLDDVIISTGYQNVKTTRMTGSVETITSKDIANKGYTSVEDILKGQMSGVSTMSISGRPGASAEIRIRGINSITGDSNPMWIVDGMPLQGDVPSISMGGTEFQESILTNGVGNIPPDDIESITVLKDAAATAIYGARAANGVIVVTTKRGTAGKASIQVKASYAVSESPRNRLQMMTTQEKINYERGVYEDFPGMNSKGRVFDLLKKADNGIISKNQAEAEIARLSQIDTDWYKEIFRVAQTQNHSITLSGGDEKTQYYGNLSYLNEQGIVPNNKYQSINGSLKLTHNFNKRLRIYFDLYSNIRDDRSTASRINPLNYATFANTYERPYDENGNYDYDRSYSNAMSSVKDGYEYDVNVLKDLNENTSRSKYLSNQMTLKLEVKILEGLMFTTTGTYAISTSKTKKELVPGSYSSKAGAWLNGFMNEEIPDILNQGKLDESSSRSDSWTIRNQLEFARGFNNEKHYVNVLLGQEVSSKMGEGFSSMMPQWDPSYGVASYPNISSGVAINKLNFGSHNESQDRSVSFFIAGTYSFKDKYVFSASARVDGADIIGTSNRFQPLWNVSGKWNIHNENFMSGVTFFDQLAIRGSYGFTGSIDRNVLPFSTLSRLTSSSYGNPYYDGEPVMNVYKPAQPSIKWQRKEEKNIGLDVSMLNSRLNLNVNYYHNDTRRVIGTNYVAMSSGYQSLKANLASLRNNGWEISLKTVNIKTRDFNWTTSFNIAINNNVVTDTEYKSLDDYPTSAIMNGNFRNGLYIKGYSTGARFGYEFAGIDEANGGTLIYVDGYDADGKRLGSPYKDGRYVYNADELGNPRSSSIPEEYVLASRKLLGDSYPPINGGFSTTFNYKRFSLSTSFAFYTGHIIDSYLTLYDDLGASAYLSSYNVMKNEANRWRKPGDMTDVSKYSTLTTARTAFVYDNSYESGNYLKCTNVSFGYNMPQKWCEKLLLTNMRLTFNASNLFTVTKYRGVDPETMGAFGYPSARKYNFALTVGF